MDDLENEGLRHSRIPHPRTLAAPSLHEMSQSQHNSRSQSSMMRMPAPTGIKRPGTELQPQSDTKRQTLVERAAEYNGKRSVAGIPTATTALGTGLKPSSIVSLATKQQNGKVPKPTSSFARSTLRATNAPTRPGTSVGHITQSAAPGAAGAGTHSLKQSLGAAVRRKPTSRPRPVTAMDRYDTEDTGEPPLLGAMQQQNGTVTISSPSILRVPPRQPRKTTSVHSRRSSGAASLESRQSSGAGSLATSFAALGMGGHTPCRETEIRCSQPIDCPKYRQWCTKHPASASESPAPLCLQDSTLGQVLETGRSISGSTCSSASGASPTPDSSASSVHPPPMPMQYRMPATTGICTPKTTCRAVAVEMAKMEHTLSAAKMPSPGKPRPHFMAKDSNARGFVVLDVDERLRDVESQFSTMKCVFDQSIAERSSLEELVELSKARVTDLQRQRDLQEEKYASAQMELEALRSELQTATLNVEGERRQHAYKIEDLARKHRCEVDDMHREFENVQDRARRDHQDALSALERRFKAEQDEEASRSAQEIRELRAKLGSEQQGLHVELQQKDKQLQQARADMVEVQADLDRERLLKTALQSRLSESSAQNVELEERTRMLQAQVDFLKSGSRQQSDQYAAMEARMQEAVKIADDARQKLIKEETERRILFNKYQELKGNIRVMCRVRPAMEGVESDKAAIAFPDADTSSTQIDVVGPEEKNSLGVASRKTMPFEFDRVFAPAVQNAEVFDEIAQLVQSALDGYNVCIFCYGQTGSGKTYTMSSADGMIPRATHMIYDSIRRLKEKSWSYTMEGSFIEVYNEELNDLLGGPSSSPGTTARDQDAKKKLEIRHDDVRKTTTVVGCKSVQLDSSAEVESMLRLAQSNRSVAATKANERSSRSHSIFMLKLVGHNSATGQRCEGTLNLVDLAGSERLKHSGAEGDRKKETQSINKSLACLGDVIEALGRGAPHIPYRNSKLTHLLQYSLGGNSKTLMFVMVSPLETHLKETLTSLRFATKVHNTHIGTAKATNKMDKA